VRIVYRGGDSSKEGKTHLWKEGLSTESETCLRMGRLTYGGGGLCTEGRDLSTDGETRLLRGRLVYRAEGLSTERETRLQRARLFCGGTESILLGPPGRAQAFPNLRPGLLNCWRGTERVKITRESNLSQDQPSVPHSPGE
jgi:hypothetical protein